MINLDLFFFTSARNTILAGVLSLMLLSGCSTADEAQEKFEQQAMQFPNGITETDAAGNVISQDPDDWRVSPLYESFVEVSPAYPNPTTGENIEIELLITGLGAVPGLEVYFFNRDNLLSGGGSNFLYFDERNPLPVGYTSIFLNPTQFSGSSTIAGAVGLHRVLIYDRRGSIISYGDIKVE